MATVIARVTSKASAITVTERAGTPNCSGGPGPAATNSGSDRNATADATVPVSTPSTRPMINVNACSTTIDRRSMGAGIPTALRAASSGARRLAATARTKAVAPTASAAAATAATRNWV